tara:strand:+ start:1695 stop:1919 length:225 start_codon:yes stop_codon:yes gene_type:complete
MQTKKQRICETTIDAALSIIINSFLGLFAIYVLDIKVVQSVSLIISGQVIMYTVSYYRRKLCDKYLHILEDTII